MNALSATDILTKEEVRKCLDRCRNDRSPKNHRQNEIVFRLAACCGLRASEMCGLSIKDFMLGGPRPCIRVQKKTVKGRSRMRSVPLWWDAENLEVLAAWIAHRRHQGASGRDPVISSLAVTRPTRRLGRRDVAKRWKYAIKSLGPDRVRQLSIHCGRHTFCSHSLAVGHSLVEVQQAMGHSSLAMTSIYAHIVERTNVPDLYA